MHHDQPQRERHQSSRTHGVHGCDARHARRAVDQRDAFLVAQHRRFEIRGAQRIGTRHAPAANRHLAFADQCKGDVGQRRQVAAGAHGAHFRYDRDDVPVQALEQQRVERCADAGIPPRQAGGARGHGGAHMSFGEWGTDAGGEVIDQVALQFLRMLGRHGVGCERAVARGHAVNAPALLHHASQGVRCSVHAVRRRRAQPDAAATGCDSKDVMRRELAADVHRGRVRLRRDEQIEALACDVEH